MMDWAASSEMIVMLVVLGFLLVELVSIRRTIKRDKAKLAGRATPDTPEKPTSPN